MNNLIPLIQEVVENDLCISCGACKEVCTKENLSSKFSVKRGAWEVEIKDINVCRDCDEPCKIVCPSIGVDFIAQREALGSDLEAGDTSKPKRDGWINSTYLAKSTRFGDGAVSSSGGVIRAMVDYHLSIGNNVLCLGWDLLSQRYAPILLEEEKDLECVPGSIYHDTSFEGTIDLLRSSDKPVLVVAIPCQLSGLLQYINYRERDLGKKITLVVGVVCGWSYSHHSIRAFSSHNNLVSPEIEKTTYRGGDRYGKLKIHSDGNVYEFERKNIIGVRQQLIYKSSFSRDFNRLRCRLCENHLNMGADLIAGDAWLDRNSDKKSVVASRTNRGEQALQQLNNEGLVVLEDATFQDFIESQSGNLVYGSAARKLNNILTKKGIVTPLYNYDDSSESVDVTSMDKFVFAVERVRRYFGRRNYKIHLFLYVLTNFRISMKTIRRRILNGN